MDISNKALALVLVAAIVVSLGGTFVAMDKISGLSGVTGRVVDTDQGTVYLEITSNITIEFDPNTVNWTSGYVTQGQDNCTLNTSEYTGSSPSTPAGCTGFTQVNEPLTVRNIGSVNVSLNFTASDNAASFIGGTNPVWQLNITNNASNSGCPGALNDSVTWVDVTAAGQWVCGNGVAADDTMFTYNVGGNPGAIDFDVFVLIPNDAPTGAKVATITANAFG